jgi:hypothetical protein
VFRVVLHPLQPPLETVGVDLPHAERIDDGLSARCLGAEALSALTLAFTAASNRQSASVAGRVRVGFSSRCTE